VTCLEPSALDLRPASAPLAVALSGAAATAPMEPGDPSYVVAADCGGPSSFGRDSFGRQRPAPQVPCP
jgi:hypothetical protein